MSNDILTELRQRGAAIERQGETDWFYDDAADEIERLRAEIALLRADNNRRALLEAGLRYGIERYREAIRRIAEQDATLSVCDGNVTVTMDATLTDAERAAVAWAEDCADSQREWKIGAILRGLLERMEHRQT